MEKGWIKIGVRIFKWLLGLLLFWNFVIMYGLSLLFHKDYRRISIYVHATHETFYLISYRPLTDTGNRIILTTDFFWRISANYKSPEREYWYPDPNGFTEEQQAIYYKVSNDTLYISPQYMIEKPLKWKQKTKIVQVPHSTDNEYGKYEDMDISALKVEELERLHFTRFP